MGKFINALDKSVAGAVDVTLTETECTNGTINFTGALTGDINVIVPTTRRKYTFFNSTSGAHTLMVKTASGDGIIVTQGSRAELTCDGTNVTRSLLAGDSPALSFASQAEAEAGVATDKPLNALRVAQAIAALGGSSIPSLTGTAGEALSALDSIRMELEGGDNTPGRIYKTDGSKESTSTKSWFLGFAAASAAEGASVQITDTLMAGFSGLTPGAPQYASATPGAITETPPAFPLVVGIAASATAILCNRRGYQGTLLAAEPDPWAAIGSGGGPAVWFKADAIGGLSDGDPVSTWADSSGNGNDATQTSTARPTYKTNIINGLPVVRFDGSNDWLDIGDISALFPTAATLFVVGNGGTANHQSFYETGSSDAYWRFISDHDAYMRCFRSSRADHISTEMPSTGNHIYRLISSGANYQLWVDGASQGTAGAEFVAGTSHKIGKNGSGDAFHPGDIAEILIWNEALSGGDMTAVEAVLAAKYGL